MAGANGNKDRSKYAESKVPLLNIGQVYQEIPIVNIRLPDSEARQWNVTLGRLNRADKAAPIDKNGSGWNQHYPTQLYPFAAGYFNAFVSPPPFPPSRVNYPYQSDIANSLESFVLVGWGQNNLGRNNENRIVADWPMLGQTFTVYGSSVEIWGVARFSSALITPNELPQFSAMITPSESHSPHNWLTLSQRATDLVAPLTPSVGSVATDPTSGGLMFSIPDFARQVKVSVTLNSQGIVNPDNTKLWDTFAVQYYVVFWDDKKQIVLSHNQSGVNTSFLDIPARATMMCIYRRSPDDINNISATVLWRISP